MISKLVLFYFLFRYENVSLAFPTFSFVSEVCGKFCSEGSRTQKLSFTTRKNSAVTSFFHFKEILIENEIYHRYSP
jgi:hypothetical protein